MAVTQKSKVISEIELLFNFHKFNFNFVFLNIVNTAMGDLNLADK
jgi:hypothetical protein